ncbi:MAG TPA: anti-sigma factor [Candidatus Dormibacteraeota bacterium]|jgi:anti-sigma factor RsiW|nr:anti-sigma factor [Candidatus Dormibacteraeota bacterium]
MICETWTEKLDAYLDGELATSEARALGEHLRGCAGCAAESLSRVQQKRALQAAGQRFVPDPAFRARIQKSIAAKPRHWSRFWFPALATAAVLLIAAVFPLTINRERRGDQQLLSELADLHVATLASSNPVDVVSTDRHTVKPWFAGKIPFTFNLPELQDSPFTLVGGKVSYLNQSPGAELIFRVRQHQISVFIFQEQALGNTRSEDAVQTALSFNVRSWSHNGLRYFMISDVSPGDLDRLSEMMKAAG